MKDRLLTIALSIAATLTVTHLTQAPRHPPRKAAAEEPREELVIDRLIVRRELVVSDIGAPPVTSPGTSISTASGGR